MDRELTQGFKREQDIYSEDKQILMVWASGKKSGTNWVIACKRFKLQLTGERESGREMKLGSKFVAQDN